MIKKYLKQIIIAFISLMMLILLSCGGELNTSLSNTVKSIVGVWETDEALGFFNCYAVSSSSKDIFWVYDENGNEIFSDSITDKFCPNLGTKLTFTDKGEYTAIKSGLEISGTYELNDGILTIKTPITVSSNALYSMDIIFIDKDTLLLRDREQAPNMLNSEYMYAKYNRLGTSTNNNVNVDSTKTDNPNPNVNDIINAVNAATGRTISPTDDVFT